MLVAATLLAAPIGVALSVARVRSPTAWVVAAVVVLLVAGAWIALSSDPADAAFFVGSGE